MRHEVIHIGFPKTATTTLQESFFGRQASLTNLARPFCDRERSRICTALALGDDDEYDEEALARAVASARDSGPGPLLYSDETVVNSRIRTIAAKRLKRLFPDAHIIAVLRNQLDAFASYYAAHGSKLRPAPEPYSGRHVSFANYLDFHYANPKRGFLPTLRYDAILELYAGLFGEERIHILLFEQFKQDRPEFMASLAAILGVDAEEAGALVASGHARPRPKASNVQYDAIRSSMLRGVPLSRIVPGSRYLKAGLMRLLGNEPMDPQYPDGWDAKLGDMFREGNRALRDRYNLELERFGYPL